MNYYNEFDPKAAATLRELIAQGHIAKGIVDERSIEDVVPSDLNGFNQVHLFAGFGIWSLALRYAGVQDDTPVWTASCPCQPFSAAGKGIGFSDERHLWPAAFHLIHNAKRPEVPLYGEQVASSRVMPWVDLVQDDLEATGATFWAIILASAGFGAPIIRQRTFWMARTPSERLEQRLGRERASWSVESRKQFERLCDVSGLGESELSSIERLGEYSGEGLRIEDAKGSPGRSLVSELEGIGSNPRVLQRDGAGHAASTIVNGFQGGSEQALLREGRRDEGNEIGRGGSPLDDGSERTGPVNGIWEVADWLRCRDELWRPVESGTFPLAHGDSERVGRLRGYGNAISPIPAAYFIKACEESWGE